MKHFVLACIALLLPLTAAAEDRCMQIFADYEIGLDWLEVQLRRPGLADAAAVESRFDTLAGTEARYGVLCFRYFDRGRTLVERRLKLHRKWSTLTDRSTESRQAAASTEPWPPDDAPPDDDKAPKDDEPATPQPPPASGTLTVTSYPIGAEVFIDGAPRGRTQLEVTAELSPGEHVLELWHGNLRAMKTITIEPGHHHAHRINLLQQGKLTERTRAAIRDDTEDEVPEYEVPEDDNEEEAAEATVEEGWNALQQVRSAIESDDPDPSSALEAVAREPGPLPGSVVVTSQPPGASVFLDDALCGKTPLKIAPVPPGAHRVRLAVGPYRLTYVVGVKSGGMARLDIPLRKAIVEQAIDAERF